MSEASDITGSKGCHGGLSTLLVCLLLLASPLLSDVAQTPGGRVVGDVAFAKASLSLTGKPIAWQDLVWFSRQQAQPLQFLSSAVGFAGGDRVAGKIIDLQGDSLGVQSSLIGRRNLPLEQLSAMEFLADSLPATLDEKGVLYRQDGEPVPGGILWMDGRQIALDSPLGMLMIKRPQASAYVFDVDAIKKAKARKATTSSSAPATTSAPAKPTVYAADADFVGDFEVSLIDGSRLHGRLAPQDGALVLDHKVLGQLSIPAGAVQSLMRYRPSIVYLKDLPEQVQAKPVLVKAPTVQKLQYYRGEVPARMFLCLYGLAVQPETTVRYKLDRLAGRKLLATIQPIPGSRGDCHVRVSSGGAVVFEQDVTATADPAAVSVDLPESDDLVIEVALPAKVAYPCGVIVGDGAIVLK